MSLLARFLKIATLATAALLAACGGGGGGGGGGGPIFTDAGTLKLALTDAAACGYNQINVTVQKVRVHQSATAADGDAGWSEVTVPAASQRVDLLSLTNGAVVELGQVTLPVGTYRQMSLVLAANSAATPLANSVTPIGLGERALGLPANLNFKIPVAITIVKDQTSDFVIDFDACNSVQRLGLSGNYNLSPRYSVIQRFSATGQRITGYVSTAFAPATTRIYAEQGGIIVRSTSPDVNGQFILYPLPAGNYDVVVSALGSVPAVVTGVPASNTASTDINNQGARIQPPPSTPHTASGSVSIAGATTIDALVQVFKNYTGGPDVVIAGAPVDATTGTFAYTLPSGAAERAAFTPGLPLSFVPDPAVPTGRYTIAVTAGAATKSASVDVSNGDATPPPFTFP